MSRFIVCLTSLVCIMGMQLRAQNSLSDTNQLAPDTVMFRFVPGNLMFFAEYKDNAAAIESLSRQIRENIGNIESDSVKIRVCGYCSSYDSFQENLAAAKNRSNQVKSYFIVHEGLKEQNFKTSNSTRPWRGMTDVVVVAYMQPESSDSDDALSVNRQDKTEETVVKDQTDVRPKPESTAKSPTKSDGESSEKRGSELVPGQKVMTTESQTAINADQQPDYKWALKTNVVYLAATVANIGAEFNLGQHFSLDVPFVFSPYTVSRNYRLKIMAVQPELRYWFSKPMQKHFLGVHLLTGVFNVSLNKDDRYQTPNGFYGVGLSYGYTLPFARRWAAEFTLGAGYVFTEYDAYYNIDNGARYEKNVPYHYWGITKAGVNMIYKFGK